MGIVKQKCFATIKLFIVAIIVTGIFSYNVNAEETRDIEEIIVVGTQIKGAKISDALAVSVITADDIEILGIDSGEGLLQIIPENGQNFFSEAENISGGVNSARGDVGAFNLRNIGTGNTLALLNGRRLVNSATFQTEEVGGSFVPVNTANSNILPVYGVKRIEVLRDGASAIYGADAVAGVINTVLKDDFEGFNVKLRWKEFDNLPRNDQSIVAEWGNNFNDNKTNVGVFFNFFQRDRVNSQDDPRWANADFRSRIPIDSPFEGNTAFRNDSTNSGFGQYDVVSSVGSSNSLRVNNITDNAGEFETYPIGDARCQYVINTTTCGAADGQGTFRYNLNENRDLASDLQRYNLFININHKIDDTLESFTELSYYRSKTNLFRHPSAQLSAVRLRVGAGNFYNPLGPCGSSNRLSDSMIGTDVPCEGLALTIDNYRFTEVPRIIDNNGDTYRILQGLRGQWGDWDWESAFSWSESNKEDITHNRISNTLIQEALNNTTAAAYNPFTDVNTNIEQALIDVRRDSEADLTTLDIKVSNTNVYELPAGSIGFAGGIELRHESFEDDRDPRLDGTIQFTTSSGTTFPFVSDVVNSSPTSDNSGDRNVASLFAELQLPVLSNLNVQLALRHEHFSDVNDPTVGRVAFGYRPIEQLLVRGSWSQSFRAPNLVTINEAIIARNNTRDDFTCLYAAANGGDPDQDILDCRNSIQRTAQGSSELEAEESDNYSIGIVIEPIQDLTVTFDYWSIEKTNTIGLFGEENHTVLELLNRIENGNNNCSSTFFNSAVERESVTDEQIAIYNAAGICPAGDIIRINDVYANLDTRIVEGYDIGVYYSIDTDIGNFNFKYNASLLGTYEQEASGNSVRILAAVAGGVLTPDSITGFGDLIGQDGNQEYKHTMALSWRNNNFGASLSWYRLGEFFQNSLTLADGTRYEIPAFDNYNATFTYRTEIASKEASFRIGVNNLTDERAPLADRFFGFFADAHTDYGRYVYLDVKVGIF